jgi:uncharacterized membrane protein (DUF2068 family)
MKKRMFVDFETFSCAFRGHVLVGTEARNIEPSDSMVVRELGGLRWHRCLRCDSWIPKPRPTNPTEDCVPSRQEIEVPTRGRELRDRYVLRLIAIDRAIHVTVLVLFALVVLIFAGHEAAIQRDYVQVMNSLSGGPTSRNGVHNFLGHFHHLFEIKPNSLIEVVILACAYASLEATEAVGLWYAKRWAEYLTLIATIVFIPYEIYELTRGVTTFKLVLFIINVAIALYLLLAKRLFGLRGGHKALEAQRATTSGWSAIERATIEPPGVVTTP